VISPKPELILAHATPIIENLFITNSSNVSIYLPNKLKAITFERPTTINALAANNTIKTKRILEKK
jgi:hypothetical protein